MEDELELLLEELHDLVEELLLEELEELDNELEELELLLEELLLEEQGFTGFKLWNKRISLATSHLWSNRITCKVLNKMREQKTICLLELTSGILENEYLIFYFLTVKHWGIVICLGYLASSSSSSHKTPTLPSSLTSPSSERDLFIVFMLVQSEDTLLVLCRSSCPYQQWPGLMSLEHPSHHEAALSYNHCNLSHCLLPPD